MRKQTKAKRKSGWERAAAWTREGFVEASTRGEARREYSPRWWRKGATVLLLLLVAITAHADEVQASQCEVSHPMGDAWWTGPMLANTAATVPRGHMTMEAYLFDVRTRGSFDDHGTRHNTAPANSYGSESYIVFGLTDKWNVGMLPTFNYNMVSGEPSSAGPGAGDLTLQVQRRLTKFVPCRRVPAISAAVQETLPTGRYDRLGNRRTDGMGAGAYTTNLELFSQMYFWLPNRRIVRMRFNVMDSISSHAPVDGVSVYGTGAGFRGRAKPGSSFFVDAAWEYSLTRSWVLALDATYGNARNTRVTGCDSAGGKGMTPVVMDSGVSDAFGFAPAIEYSWKPSIGVLVGVRVIPAGRNTNETVTPAIAINFVR